MAATKGDSLSASSHKATIVANLSHGQAPTTHFPCEDMGMT